ncbi:MAG: hypothetical protein QNJ51_24050 [Calothrix sp. MO_167.B12]|nr:hypothetical protein [Calothrix sp. MO_167.B12]
MSEQFNGTVDIRDSANNTTIRLNGNTGDFTVWREIGTERREVLKFDAKYAAFYVGSEGNEGDIIVRDGAGRQVFHFDSNYAALYVGAAGNEGDIIVRDGSGNERIRLDGHTGDIKLSGADCAEEFDIVKAKEITPGTVLVIDNDGKLAPCERSYDKKVAGVVSGANGLTPGIILDRNGSLSERLPIALTGKVYCKADAQFAPIEVGDLLTTSPTMGHAMKANDPLQAFGTVIGKALRDLKDGQDLIPILVSLQ